MAEKIKSNDIFYFYGSLVLVTILISVAALLYKQGYRLQSFHLAKTGSLEVAVYEAGSQVFLDDVLQKTTVGTEETLTFSQLSPQNHTLTVEKDGFQTLHENVGITSEEIKKVTTFLLPTDIKTEKITDEDTKKQIAFLFDHTETPSSLKKRSFGATAIWAGNNSVYAMWTGGAQSIPPYLCTKTSSCENAPISIIDPDEPVSNVDFYKDREDVLIVSYKTHIDIVEMNGQTGVSSHTIYKGKEVSFYKDSDDTLYVKDQKDFFRISL